MRGAGFSDGGEVLVPSRQEVLGHHAGPRAHSGERLAHGLLGQERSEIVWDRHGNARYPSV